MEPLEFTLKNRCVLSLRELEPDDARELLGYIDRVSGESDFLTFGRGEFELDEAEERAFLERCAKADHELYLGAEIDSQLVGTLHFSAGRRARVRHSGELSMSVRRADWGLGIGGLLLDALADWARSLGVVTKLNLRVRTDNTRAIRLYERKGFVREGTLRNEIFHGGRYYDHLCMGRTL